MAILTKEEQSAERLKANRQVIKSYRLKDLDSKSAISNYTTEIKRVNERKQTHLTVVKKEETNA